MKVVVDMQKLINPYSGLGQFCLNLGKNLQQQKNSAVDFLFFGKKDKHFDDVRFFEPALYEKISGNISGDCEVWHCTHQEPKFLPNKNVKLILTIHDLNFLYKYKSKWRINTKIRKLQKLINRADAIVAVSDFTMKEVQNNFFIREIPCKVIYNGISLDLNLKPQKPDFISGEAFLFTIGIVSPKKNFHVLLPLVAQTNFKLIIAGDNKTDYAKEILQMARDKNIEEKIIMPGKVSEEEKLWLYQNCEAFVFPSISEGFGLPVVEAMHYGKPVFLSNRTSLPEIGANAAFYWDNFEPGYMYKILNEGMKLYKIDLNCKQKLIDQSKKFSWSTAAVQYLDLYHLLANKKDKIN